MLTRHKLPSQRRQSSVLYPDTPTFSSQPLSSSFFAILDPLTPARQSSLHLYPQNIFPSKINHLDSRLEVPYAFAHQDAAFYWSRDDALVNHKLNIWAKPPCLNCVLEGKDYGWQCDRYERQEASQGRVRCCTRCARIGNVSSCIEQVEIRADGNYGHVEKSENEKEMTEFGQWCGEEQELRKTRLVWWKPINLDFGDVDRKRLVVERSKQRAGYVRPMPIVGIDSGKALWKTQQAEGQLARKRMLLCQQMNQEPVAEWDEEDLELEPLSLPHLTRENTMASKHPSAVDEKRSTFAKEYAIKLAMDEVYWSSRIRAARIEQYSEEAAEVGLDVAETFQSAWEAIEAEVVSQMCSFLKRKRYRQSLGGTEEDAIASSAAELSGQVSEYLKDLVPQIFLAGI